MEALLIAVTVISLGLAVAMSIVAWTLLKHERQRAAARIEALEALAFVNESEHRPPAELPGPALEDGPVWDAVIRGVTSEPAAAGQTPIGEGRVRAVLPDAMFGGETASNASARRWMVVASFALIIGAAYATASAMRPPELTAAVVAPAPLAGPDVQPLELLSLRHASDGGAFSVSGFVQNPPAGKDLTNVEVVVYLFDGNDQYVTTGKAPLEMANLRSGADSSFEVHIPGTGNVGRYRVGFRQADGTVVSHVDKRGQFPDGTSETVVGPDTVRPAGGMR